MTVALDAHLEALQAGDDAAAEAAAQALIALSGSAVVPLLALLDDPRPDVRWWALRTLAEIRDPRVSPALRRALLDPDAEVRHCAALGLRHQPDPAAVPDLVAALQSDDPMLRRLAADALIAVGAEAVPALIRVAEEGAPSARREAMRALATLADRRAAQTLFDALDDPSPLVIRHAEEGLDRMGFGMVFFRPDGG